MHKANKRQDNWHAQVPLFNINQADRKYELSKEITVLQSNSLKILPKLILHCRMEKTGLGNALKISGGTGATVSPFHITVSPKREKTCEQTGQGGTGSGRAIPLGALLQSRRLSEDASLKDYSVSRGAINKRLLKQKDFPTKPTAVRDFVVRAQLVFCKTSALQVHAEVNYHTILIGAARQLVCTQGAAR